MDSFIPLAEKIRPQKLKDFIGQEHLVGKGKPVRLMIEKRQPFSSIFWGPPGSGKTTLAQIIANEIKLDFFRFSAVSAQKEDLKKIINLIQKGFYKKGSIVLLDEIHRFNKAQQDYLLPFVENGTIILIGATTENPSFEVIGPLLSRCRVFILKPLKATEIEKIIKRGLSYLKKKLNLKNIILSSKAKDFLTDFSGGDGRIVLNALEGVVSLFYKKLPLSLKSMKITLFQLEEFLQKKSLLYDKKGEEHYNTISAFIKSMRASDVDAALYYLARMIEAGEDPLFIARRMIIFASEDIGMSLPTALVVANEVFRACEVVGYPECAINLAHGAVYLSLAPKNRNVYNALKAAQKDVVKYGNLSIPLSLRNPVTHLMKDIGYGKDYEMYPQKGKSLLPVKLKGKIYYFPLINNKNKKNYKVKK